MIVMIMYYVSMHGCECCNRIIVTVSISSKLVINVFALVLVGHHIIAMLIDKLQYRILHGYMVNTRLWSGLCCFLCGVLE